jgi:hypothetical protein
MECFPNHGNAFVDGTESIFWASNRTRGSKKEIDLFTTFKVQISRKTAIDVTARGGFRPFQKRARKKSI